MEPKSEERGKKALRLARSFSAWSKGSHWTQAEPQERSTWVQCDDYCGIMLMVAWVTVSNVVTDFAFAS